MRILHRFHGGVHPPEHKAESTGQPIVVPRLPARLVVPVRQHIGNAAECLVEPGQQVLKGQMIARPEGYVSAAVHAPTSGTVVEVGSSLVPHPSGLPDLCITIEPDGQDRWIERHPVDYRNTDPSAVRNRLREMGVVGLGGAVFPSFIKLNPGFRQRLETLVLNGAECEPWITCDDMLMRERADEIVQGIEAMRALLHPEEVVIGIEDNKPEAIRAMTEACAKAHFSIEVVPVPTLYPGGGAKQLIKVLTGKEVPAGARSTDVGVQCFNVATAYTVHRALHHGEPVVSRVVTITGNVRRPGNFEALIGTPIEHLVAQAGGPQSGTNRYIMGGPMMGFDLPAPSVPLVKATNCVIAASPALFKSPPPAMPCIRCGKCAQACPADLQPHELYWFARARNFGKAQEYALFDCIECGCCSYVCPSHIPLVQYYRFAKGEIWAKEKETKAADQARQRHEFRLLRQEREKQERAEKLAQKTAAAKSRPSAEGAPSTAAENGDAAAAAKKAAIAAAIERAKAKKSGITPKNTDNLTPEQQQAVDNIETRRAQLKASLEENSDKMS